MALGQLVNDLGVDQCGIHIERHQPTSAPEHGVALHAEIEAQPLRGSHELTFQRLGVTDDPAQTDLDGHPPGDVVGQGQAPGESANGIDVQTEVLHDGGDGSELSAGFACRQQGDDVARLALSGHPLFIIAGRNRCATHRHAARAGLLLQSRQYR